MTPAAARPVAGGGSEGQLLTRKDEVRVADRAGVLLEQLLPRLAVRGGDLRQRVAALYGVAAAGRGGGGGAVAGRRGGGGAGGGGRGGRGGLGRRDGDLLGGGRSGDGGGAPREVLAADWPGADPLPGEHLL